MSQRISDEQISAFVTYRNAAMGGDRPFTFLERELFLDLRDARTRIAELERLSASQEEAHAARDRGVTK